MALRLRTRSSSRRWGRRPGGLPSGLSTGSSNIYVQAAAAGCQVLLTEDLQDGQVLDGVRVENPSH